MTHATSHRMAEDDGPTLDDDVGYDDGVEPGDCPYCRGSGLSPYSIRDVPCPHCGGQG
jgi:hypothetical protein